MSIISDIQSYEYDKNRNKLFGIKSAIVWGKHKEKNSIFPILYISKPKHLSVEDFELLLDRLEINIK